VYRRDRIAGTSDMPALFDDTIGQSPAPPPVTLDERAAALARLDAVVAAASASWVLAPTGLGSHDGDDDSGFPEPVAAGPDPDEPAYDAGRRGGRPIGRAVHAVLEHAEPDSDVVALARAAVAVEGLPVDDVATVVELATSALRSDALAAARASGRLWREVPVVATVRGRVLEGYIDLLHEDATGDLTVVDWKTDRGRTDAEVDAALGRYRLQGGAYALAVEQATGRKVSSVRFVFCRAGGAPAVEREIDDLASAVADALRVLGSGPEVGDGVGEPFGVAVQR
jgi:ATP-dependent helicase/nuclease subunit A